MTYLPTVYRQTAREVRFVLVVGLMNGFWYIYVYVTAGSHFGKLKSVRSQFVDTTSRKEKSHGLLLIPNSSDRHISLQR